MGKGAPTKEIIRISQKSLAKKLVPKRYDYYFHQYINYFSNYKFLLKASALLFFLLSFWFFQNKNYNAKTALSVNAQDNFKSNLLESSVGDLKLPSSSSFSNFSQRIYRSASNQSFFRALAKISLENPEYATILQAARKYHLGFLSAIFQDTDQHSLSEKMNMITNFLSKKTSVKLLDETEIIFSVTTKNKNLTKLIHSIIKQHATGVLLDTPVKEAITAYDIIDTKAQNVEDKLQQIANRKAILQKKYNTPSFDDYAKKYSQLKINLEGDLAKSKADLSVHQGLLKTLLSQQNFEIQNYELQEQIQDTKGLIAAEESKITSLEATLRQINRNQKDIPRLVLTLREIKRNEKILEAELFKLTGQKTFAEISIQKIKESLTELSIDESVQSSSSLTSLIKSFISSVFLFVILCSLIYYKQSFFPTVFTTEEVNQVGLPFLGVFNPHKKNKHQHEFIRNEDFLVRSFTEKNLNAHSIYTFHSLQPNPSDWNFICRTLSELLEQGQSCYLLNFNLTKSQKKQLDKLQEQYSEAFSYHNIVTKMHKNTILNDTKLLETLKQHSDYDKIIMNGMNIQNFANKAIMASLSEENYIFLNLYQTRVSRINTFSRFYNIIANKVQSNFSFLVMSKVDGINNVNYISNKKDEDHHEPLSNAS